MQSFIQYRFESCLWKRRLIEHCIHLTHSIRTRIRIIPYLNITCSQISIIQLHTSQLRTMFPKFTLLLFLVSCLLAHSARAQYNEDVCVECVDKGEGCQYCLDDSVEPGTTGDFTTFSINNVNYTSVSSFVCSCDSDANVTTSSFCVETVEDCDKYNFAETIGEIIGLATGLFIFIIVCGCLCTAGAIAACVFCCVQASK